MAEPETIFAIAVIVLAVMIFSVASFMFPNADSVERNRTVIEGPPGSGASTGSVPGEFETPAVSPAGG